MFIDLQAELQLGAGGSCPGCSLCGMLVSAGYREMEACLCNGGGHRSGRRHVSGKAGHVSYEYENAVCGRNVEYEGDSCHQSDRTSVYLYDSGDTFCLPDSESGQAGMDFLFYYLPACVCRNDGAGGFRYMDTLPSGCFSSGKPDGSRCGENGPEVRAAQTKHL